MMIGSTIRATSVSCHDEGEQHDQRERQQDRRRHELQHTPLHELGQRLDVGGHPRHQHARLVAVEEGQRLALDVIEHADPQDPQETLTGAVDEDVLLAPAEVGDDRDDDVEHDGEIEGAGVALADPGVDAVPHEQRPTDRGRGRYGDEHQRGHHGATEGRCHLRRPPQHRPRLGALETFLVTDCGGHPEHQSAPASRRRDVDVVVDVVVAAVHGGEHVPVALVGREQFAVRPCRRHAPVVEQHDHVGDRDRGRSVGDHDRRATVHHGLHRGADLVLLGWVDGARGVVEHEDPGVGDDRPGDRDPLALATRQRVPALTDQRVVPIRQLHHEVVGTGQARRRLDALEVGGRVGEGDVGGDRVVEQQRVLEHHADGSTHIVDGHVAHVDPVDLDGAHAAGRRSAAAAGRRSTCPSRSPRRARPTPLPPARV